MQFLSNKREYYLPGTVIYLGTDRFAFTSKFGLAKSFVTSGQNAGFDMSNPEEYNKFMHLYNANRLASGTDFLSFEENTPSIHKAKIIKAKKKKIRKMSMASRKKNKKKR